MKIGLLAYHFACNFGATLQLLSTYKYLEKHGHEPIVINFIAEDLEKLYRRSTSAQQIAMQESTRRSLWRETALCRNAGDIAQAIKSENIEAVIIGSDAVAQHHPFLERVVFPCKKFIALRKNTSDMEFPNPFWATWLPEVERRIPVAVMSASCQDSNYMLIPASTKRAMRKTIANYSYISVRDTWTRDMMRNISRGKCVPEVTPDPVFAFNQNAGELVPTKAEIRKKFNLPEHYILLSFKQERHGPSVNQQWIDNLKLAAAQKDVTCAILPFANGKSYGKLPLEIALPISPIDWYALIMHSDGYVGNNMHPIIVCLHNAVPFFSFDNYGTTHFNGLMSSDKSSKIKHLLQLSGQLEHRISSISIGATAPKPEHVLNSLLSFDKAKSKAFATNYLDCYNHMMDTIINRIVNA